MRLAQAGMFRTVRFFLFILQWSEQCRSQPRETTAVLFPEVSFSPIMYQQLSDICSQMANILMQQMVTYKISHHKRNVRSQ